MSGEPQARGGEVVLEPKFVLEINPQLLGFSSIHPAGVDGRGNDVVDVVWEGGEARRRVPTTTPAFTFYRQGTKSPQMVLTIERANHLQRMHLKHKESGSYFTPIIRDPYTVEPVTLVDVMRQVADAVNPQSLKGTWARRTLEVPSGPLPGREGIISLEELLQSGTINQEVYKLFLSWQDRIGAVNITPGLDLKRKCVRQFNRQVDQKLGASVISLKLLRETEGGVVVPHVYATPRPTTQMMVELTKPKAKGPATIHTVAPGRKMVRHPIPSLYSLNGVVQSGALHNAAWVWSHHAHVQTPPNDGFPHFLYRTQRLLGSAAFKERFISVCTEQEADKLQRIREGAEQTANKTAKSEIKEIAAFRLGTTVETAEQLGVEWQMFINEARNARPDFTDGQKLAEFLEQYHRKRITKSAEYIAQLQVAYDQFDAAQFESELWLMNLLETLEERKEDPELLRALGAWSTSPDSTGDRAQDGLGYNSGLLHFFEYRGARQKRGRFKDIPEPATIDGFIAFTNRLTEILKTRKHPNATHQTVIFEDESRNQRIYILLPDKKGEFVVAFKEAGEKTPKLSAMFTEVTQQGFERMVESVKKGKDRGQVRRLGPGIKLVYSTIRTKK